MIPESELDLCLRKMEIYRLKLREEGTRDGLIRTFIVAIFLLCIIFFFDASVKLLWSIPFIALVDHIIGMGNRPEELTKFYKSNVVAKLVADLCPGATFSPTQGINESILVESSLYGDAYSNRYSSSDTVSGVIDKTEFIFSEVQTDYSCTNNGNRVWTNKFKGFVFVADFHKEFRGRTTIVPPTKSFTLDKRVDLENPDFGKRFTTYSNDQVEARYILSPSMMERLIALDDKLNGIRVAFRRSMIIITIPSKKDNFEANLWMSVLDRKIVNEDLSVLKQLIEITNDLNLNTRIWSKI